MQVVGLGPKHMRMRGPCWMWTTTRLTGACTGSWPASWGAAVRRTSRLEQEYLVLADGRCALPVAYICAYGYWDQERIGEWVTQLDVRLADDQLTGDRRAVRLA